MSRLKELMYMDSTDKKIALINSLSYSEICDIEQEAEETTARILGVAKLIADMTLATIHSALVEKAYEVTK